MNARAATSRRGGSNVRAASRGSATRGSCIGGRPIHEVSGSACAGALDSTATREWSGTARPGLTMPELPTNDRSPTDARPRCIQPPPTSYGASWVSSARKLPSAACMSFGMPVTVDASTRLPTVAPSRRSQNGVRRPA